MAEGFAGGGRMAEGDDGEGRGGGGGEDFVAMEYLPPRQSAAAADFTVAVDRSLGDGGGVTGWLTSVQPMLQQRQRQRRQWESRRHQGRGGGEEDGGEGRDGLDGEGHRSHGGDAAEDPPLGGHEVISGGGREERGEEEAVMDMSSSSSSREWRRKSRGGGGFGPELRKLAVRLDRDLGQMRRIPSPLRVEIAHFRSSNPPLVASPPPSPPPPPPPPSHHQIHPRGSDGQCTRGRARMEIEEGEVTTFASPSSATGSDSSSTVGKGPPADGMGMGMGMMMAMAMENTMDITGNCKLPDHLIESVLARLPVPSLFRFRAVCRTWNALLRSPTFLRVYSEVAAPQHDWFLVVTAIFGRAVATYDPELNNWHRIPLPPPLCDLNPYPTAADGGLVCYFVYENRLRTLFVCNPLTQSLRKLPLVLKASSHISVLKMVMEDRSTSAYKVFVAGMVPSETGGDSLSMEVYDSATDRWSSSGIIPARYPKRRPVYGNGVLYVRCYDQRSLLLTYDTRLGTWHRIHAPLPHSLGYEELMQYKGHILLVGLLEENYKIESVCIWELVRQGPPPPPHWEARGEGGGPGGGEDQGPGGGQQGGLAWKQVEVMPRELFVEFFCDREYFECQEDERVLMKCCQYGDLILCVAFNISHRGPFKLLAYDLACKRWHWLPDSFKARECRTYKFIEGYIYEPRLDVVA